MDQQKFSVAELAKHYGVTRPAVYYWIRHDMPYSTERLLGRKERIIICLEDAEKFLKLSNGNDKLI